MRRALAGALALALVLSACNLGRAWMTDETDRIDRAMSAPLLAPKEDAALAGLALGPEAPAIAPASPGPGYALTPPGGQHPTRTGSARPRSSERVRRAAR